MVQKHGKRYIIDAMSSFGALPISAKTLFFDAVISSANKCLEGVPGFAFAIIRREALDASAGNAHSLSLDLHDQCRYFEATGYAKQRRIERAGLGGMDKETDPHKTQGSAGFAT